jgi:hypothetical protein
MAASALGELLRQRDNKYRNEEILQALVKALKTNKDR